MGFLLQAMPEIRNLLFDLGNVIIDLDIPATETALRELLGGREMSSFSRNEQLGLFHEYELGNISEVIFFRQFRELTESSIPDSEIRRVWNAMLLDIPLPRLHMLQRLRADYQVYLLSNTNDTHLKWVYAFLKRRYGITDFDTRFFDKPYYSHLINLRKPDIAVYEFVLADACLRPAETLFIHDNSDNI